jgi:hypothetical protein
MRKGSIVIFFLTLLNQLNAQQMELIAGHVVSISRKKDYGLLLYLDNLVI